MGNSRWVGRYLRLVAANHYPGVARPWDLLSHRDHTVVPNKGEEADRETNINKREGGDRTKTESWAFLGR